MATTSATERAGKAGRANAAKRKLRPGLRFENKARRDGYLQIAGVDEVGRGPLAGPVVAAAVILPPRFRHPFLTDSKKLSAKRREEAAATLLANDRVRHAIAWVSAEEIDEINILQATHLAMRRALNDLNKAEMPDVDFSLIDGRPVPDLPVPSQAIVKGDSVSLSIAAASVIAKVARDEFMIALSEEFPQYGFAKHKGYGTAEHLAALNKHGPIPQHRRSFAPVTAAYEALVR